METPIDTLDRRIVRALQEDVRRSYKSISDSLGVSHNTVRARMDRMLKEGVIHFAVVTSPQKVGFATTAFIGVRVDPEHLDKVASKLMSSRGASYVGHTIGHYDIMVLAHFASNRELFNFVNKEVGSMEGVVETETLVVSETLRGFPDNYQPVDDDERIDEPAAVGGSEVRAGLPAAGGN
jgi:Lrp/AsnC family transcriptional regulator for asnA, asnC and gidA